MNLLKWMVRPYLVSRYHMERLTRTGAFGRTPAVVVKTPYSPVGNQVKDGLHQFHVKQFHESSCSVASVVSVVNTLLARQGQEPGQPVTQQDLLEKVKTAHWKERMSEHGYNGRRGLPLEILGRVVLHSLDAYQIQYQSVETVQATRQPGRSKAFQEQLTSRLTRFEQEGDCLLIAHFDQGSFLKELHIPHISPVGGYDPVALTVKMLDVDTTQPFPYEISFDTFFKGISTDYNSIFRWFGYAEGGYVCIQL